MLSNNTTRENALALLGILLHPLRTPTMDESLFGAVMEFVSNEEISSADLCAAGVDYAVVKWMADRHWDDEPEEQEKWLDPEKFWT
jgi:hypothetical protein